MCVCVWRVCGMCVACVWRVCALPCGVIVCTGLPWPRTFHMVRLPSEWLQMNCLPSWCQATEWIAWKTPQTEGGGGQCFSRSERSRATISHMPHGGVGACVRRIIIETSAVQPKPPETETRALRDTTQEEK